MLRNCKHCNQTKPLEEFQYKNGTKCKYCYRKSNREKHARYRATNHNGYNLKVNLRTSKWRKTPKGRGTRQNYMRRWSNTPLGRITALRGLYRFIENHPLYNLEYLERLLKINERTLELDRPIFDDGRKVVSLGDTITT